ncbi:MAG TPA: hypothetical protein ENN73_00445 [Firmicutes bacterium]|nr:hypothetical protein [Bacillota bacterium]
MKRVSYVLLFLLLSSAVYSVPITEFDFYIPPSGMIITESSITYAKGKEFYDFSGEKYDTGNDYTFVDYGTKVWVGIGDIMGLGLDFPYLTKKRSGDAGSRKGKGIGDLTICTRFGSSRFALDFNWTMPTGSSIIKEDIAPDKYFTGGTLYTPWGGTHNLSFYALFKGSFLRGYIGYVWTIGRDFQDTYYNFNPGDSFRYGISLCHTFPSDIQVGLLVEGFQTGVNTFDDEEIPDSEVSRLDLTPYFAVDLLDGTIVYIGYTMVNSGTNVQAFNEIRIGLNVLEF